MKPARIQARKKEIRQYEEGVILSNVQTGYDRKIVLQEINLTVRMGGSLFTGTERPGKSTLLKTIIKYLPVSAGRITLLETTSLLPRTSPDGWGSALKLTPDLN